ncbi:hypothetical protein OHT57_34000 [Streptomyces sp. NBC_00285]|uniref:hypothetical protein n=1 Tax=Streptomyces sp. NBC_00285 TaxID=2975700 RepID=UPI002E2924FD|nr:hypothetical protein [Streptomyces sp. NBC_00285]
MADDKFLQALGEITVEASAVEYCVAYLVTVARGHDKSELASILKRVGAARNELLKLCQETRAARGENDGLYRDLVGLEKRMSRALWERNRLVHAVEVLRLADHLSEAELALWHPKTDTDLRVSASEMDELIRELRGIAGTTLRMTHRFNGPKPTGQMGNS